VSESLSEWLNAEVNTSNTNSNRINKKMSKWLKIDSLIKSFWLNQLSCELIVVIWLSVVLDLDLELERSKVQSTDTQY